MSEAIEKLKGKAKQVAGKVTGDDQLQAEGKGQEKAAEAREKVQEVSDKVKEHFKGDR